MAYQLLNRASHVPSGDSDVGPGIRQGIIDLENVVLVLAHIRCLSLPTTALYHFSRRLVRIHRGYLQEDHRGGGKSCQRRPYRIDCHDHHQLISIQAEGRSPTVFQNIALTVRWNQYLAIMRRDGEYGGNNLNADLTATILSSVQSQWHLGINVEIAILLSAFFQVFCFF